MANNCPICMANLDLVGRVHNCRVVKPTVNPVSGMATTASAPDGGSTYQYRNPDSRRAYMRDYMRKTRNAV